MDSLNRKNRRHKRIRKYLVGTGECPRLAVFRSSKHIYAQIIDDSKGVTLVFASDVKQDKKSTKKDAAFEIGKELAQKAAKKGITKVVFDRGGFLYHGRVEKVALGAREGGLKF